jgi:hypothetical protein
MLLIGVSRPIRTLLAEDEVSAKLESSFRFGG